MVLGGVLLPGWFLGVTHREEASLCACAPRDSLHGTDAGQGAVDGAVAMSGDVCELSPGVSMTVSRCSASPSVMLSYCQRLVVP